jgi:hypothetical protein
MKKEIKQIAIHQTSKTIAVMHTFIMLIPTLFSVLSLISNKEMGKAVIVMVILPLLVWIFTYLATLISCFFYNLAARTVGGIEFNLIDREQVNPIPNQNQKDQTNTV